MARKPVYHSLPELGSLHPEFRSFGPTVNKSAALLPCLRETIGRVRGDAPLAFYPMRETARFFGVSLRSVHQAYERLEAEGLLVRQRGAQTLVQGRRLQPRDPVRGVAGIPIYLPGFVYGSELRSFYINFETELRRHHFVADFIFFRAEEQDQCEDLAERLLEHHLDLVVWVSPSPKVSPVLERLHDGGISLVVLSDGKSNYPSPQYAIDQQQALRHCFTAWLDEGVRTAAVFREPVREGQHLYELAQRTANACGLDCHGFELTDLETIERFRSLALGRTAGVVLVQHRWYRTLCDRFPVAMERLFNSCRVLLPQGAPVCGYFQGKSVPADVVSWDTEAVARRVAADISARKTGTTELLATFRPRWTPRFSLGEAAERI